VRNKAMEVLGRCHAQLGPSLLSFLEGLKPAQLTALEEHFRQNPQTEVGCGGGRAAPGPAAACQLSPAGGGAHSAAPPCRLQCCDLHKMWSVADGSRGGLNPRLARFALLQVVPTRKVRSKKKGGGASATGPAAAARGPVASGEAFEEEEEEAEGASLNPDDLLPRTDISGGVTPSLLAMLGSSNWKERNAGVDALAALLAEANHRIEPNVGELFPALKVCSFGGWGGVGGTCWSPAARSRGRVYFLRNV
jgi:hypothetical protein